MVFELLQGVGPCVAGVCGVGPLGDDSVVAGDKHRHKRLYLAAVAQCLSRAPREHSYLSAMRQNKNNIIYIYTQNKKRANSACEWMLFALDLGRLCLNDEAESIRGQICVSRLWWWWWWVPSLLSEIFDYFISFVGVGGP